MASHRAGRNSNSPPSLSHCSALNQKSRRPYLTGLARSYFLTRRAAPSDPIFWSNGIRAIASQPLRSRSPAPEVFLKSIDDKVASLLGVSQGTFGCPLVHFRNLAGITDFHAKRREPICEDHSFCQSLVTLADQFS